MVADFTLTAGLAPGAGEIDKLIQDIQGQVNRKKISIPFTPDQYSVQVFSKRLSDELKKSGVEIQAKVNTSSVKTFIRELQGQLNKSAVLSIPFVPAQHSIQEFAQKLQQEINKADVKVEVKVDAKQARQAASGVDDAKKKVTELNSVLKEYYQLSAKEIKLGGLGGEEYEAVAKRLEVLRSRLSELGVSAEELRTAFDNNSLKEYIQSLTGVELTSEQLDKIIKTITDGLIKEAHAMDQSAKSSRDKADADRAAKEAEEAARKAGQERLNTINKLTTSVKSYITAFLGFATVTQLVKKVYDNVLQLDKAVVDLQIATGKTRDEAADLVKQYSALGQQLGVQTKDVAESAVAWLRQGNSIEDTNKLIVASTMLSKLGRIEVSEATKDLTSTMKGYGIEVNDVISIIDRLTAVDLKAATSAGDIATAMQKTAVTANQVGIPLERLIGMVATLSEVSQQSPETVGTGMKSMLARMVNIKAGHLEDPETGEALNNVESALRGVGIQLRDVNGQFRNTNDVLEEVAGRWKSFTSLQQNAVAVSLGGTRQQENVRILMEYWDKVVSLTDVASNSAGTAEKKFEAYTEGVEARIESLKAAWQSLSDTVLSSDFVKGAVDVLTKIVNLLDQISPKLLVIGGILTKIAAGALKTGMASALAEGATYLGGLQAGLTSIGTTFSSIIGGIIGLVSKLWAVIAPFAPYLAIAAAAIGAVTIAIKLAKKETVDWNKAFEESKADFEKRSAGIADNTEKIEDYNEKLDENKKRLNELNALKDDGVITAAQEQEITNIELQNKKYETQIGLLQKKNEELAKGLSISLQGEVDAYGKKDFDLFSHEDAVDSVTLKRTLGFLGFGDKAFDAVRQSFYDEEGMLVDDLVESYLSGFDEVKSGMAVSLQDILDMYEVYKSAFMLDEVGPEFEDYQVDIDYAVLFLESRIQEAINSYQTFLNDAIRIGDTALAESIRSQMRTLYNALGWDWSMMDGGSGKKTASTTSKPTYNWRSNNAEIVNEAEAEARKQVRAIAGIRAAVLAEQQRAVNISRGIFDFETYDDAWYAQHFPDFEQQRNTIIKAYPALEEYFELWGRGVITGEELAAKIDEITNAVEKTPTNKDAFNSVKAILDADWDVDKQAAVASFGELAQKLGATEPQVKAMMDALMATSDKNMILDSLIMFFEGIGIKGVDELVKKLKDLKETVETPAKPGIGDYWQRFKDAVSAFDKAANPSEKTKAIADMIDTLAKVHLDQDVFDKILGHILDLKAGNIDLEEFKDIIYDLAQEYPEFAQYANFDWDKAIPPTNVKDAFNALKEVFDADWSVDRNSAIEKLGSVAKDLGVNDDAISSMSVMLLNAGSDAQRDSIIDMIVQFLRSSKIEGANELIKNLLALKSEKADPFESFEKAVSSFGSAVDAAQKFAAAQELMDAAHAAFSEDEKLMESARSFIYQLINGEIDLDAFKNKIAELLKGTKYGLKVDFNWFEVKPKTVERIKTVMEDIKSLKDASTQADRETIFNKIKEEIEASSDLTDEAKQKIIDFATAIRDGEISADDFGGKLWEIAGILEDILNIPIQKYLEDAFKPATAGAERAREAVKTLREELEKLGSVNDDDNNSSSVDGFSSGIIMGAGTGTRTLKAMSTRTPKSLGWSFQSVALELGKYGIDTEDIAGVHGSDLIAAGWADLISNIDPDEFLAIFPQVYSTEGPYSSSAIFTPIDPKTGDVYSPSFLDEYASHVLDGAEDYLGLHVGEWFYSDIENAFADADFISELIDNFFENEIAYGRNPEKLYDKKRYDKYDLISHDEWWDSISLWLQNSIMEDESRPSVELTEEEIQEAIANNSNHSGVLGFTNSGVTYVSLQEVLDALYGDERASGSYYRPQGRKRRVLNAIKGPVRALAEQTDDTGLGSISAEAAEEAVEEAEIWKDAINTIISMYPELTEAAYGFIAAMEAGDKDAAESWLGQIESGIDIAEAADNVSKLESAMSKLLGAESGSIGQQRAYGELLQLLMQFGYGPGTQAYEAISAIAKEFMTGAINADKFKEKIYGVLQALSMEKLLSGSFTPESMESRMGTALGATTAGPSYNSNFIDAGNALMGMNPGDMLTSEQQDALLSTLPELTDELRKYAEAVQQSGANSEKAAAALADLQNSFGGLLQDSGVSQFNDAVKDIVSGMKDLDVESNAYAEGIESIADAYGISEETARDYFDELQGAIDGSTDSWHEFQKAATEDIFAEVELQGDFNTDDLLAGLYTVQHVIDATGWSSEELQEKLIANGLFEEVPNTLAGKIKIPEFDVPGTTLHFPGAEVDASYEQPLLKPTDAFNNTAPKKHGGGGGKKSPKTSGKTSILSEQYTNDKGLYDTLIDNLKNLNNLYEEGSEEWLRNQQRIIETYQAYAKTIQDEYDRLVKAGVDMTDKEMQTLAKDLLKVNKEMYNAAKEYWEAVRDNMKESMQHIVDQMDAVLELRDAHKDLLTSLRQENRELEKQYKIAQDEAAHPGLTEAEREMLFSTEDYKRLTGMLKDISEQADALYEEYRNKIASVTEDETYAISYITDEYERQLGLLESQYEIAKQQLAVEKARQELQNTLRERNTAVLINGVWTWMADPDAVQAAMEKVADAEVELEDAITDAEYNKETAEIETARDAIKSSIDAMEALEFAIEDLAEGIVDLADAINEKIFNSIGTTSRNYLNQTKGHGLEMFMNELTELQETSGLVFSNSDVEKLYSLLSSGNTINSANVFDDSIVHDSAAIASILNSTTNSTAGAQNVIYINGIQLSDADSEMLLNALDRVAYTWQA